MSFIPTLQTDSRIWSGKRTDADVLHDLRYVFDCRVDRCGSRETCHPSPADTDEDFLVEIGARSWSDAVAKVVHALCEAGFKWEGSEHYQDAAANGFMSWRRGTLNLIVTTNGNFANKHRVATALCKRLNLLSKQDRIAVFQAVLYGKEWI